MAAWASFFIVVVVVLRRWRSSQPGRRSNNRRSSTRCVTLCTRKTTPLRSVGHRLQGWGGVGWKGVNEHLHYIQDLCSSFGVQAQMQSKQVNWCFVFTLIRVCVRDFCLGCPCPSSSLHVAIFSDADVRVRAMHMPKAVCSRDRYCRLPKCAWPWMTSDRSLGYNLNKTLSGAWTQDSGTDTRTI